MKKFKSFLETSVASVDELKQIYARFLPQLKDRSLLLLMGPVGAGKTTSVQLIAELLGIRNVASPSFAIHHRYENPQGHSIDHVDLYRLEDDEDLESTGFWDLFAQEKSLVVVEWADRLNLDALPLNWFQVQIHLDLVDGNTGQRRLRIDIES